MTQGYDLDPAIEAVDVLTQRRMNDPAVEPDHYLDLEIRGYRIGDTGKVRWLITQNGDMEYDEQYVADVLEKVILVIRHNDEDTDVIEGRCPHDGQTCIHNCQGDECWRELDGS